MDDEVLVMLDYEQIDVILLALQRFKTYLYEGGRTGERNEKHIAYVENLIYLIYYLKSRKQETIDMNKN